MRYCLAIWGGGASEAMRGSRVESDILQLCFLALLAEKGLDAKGAKRLGPSDEGRGWDWFMGCASVCAV